MNRYSKDVEESFKDLENLLSLENKKYKVENKINTDTYEVPYKYLNKNSEYYRHKKDPLISKYEKEWILKQNNMGISTKVNISHSCLNEECQKYGNIIYLGENIFRCEKSGMVHICDRFNICDQIIITKEETRTCYISLYNFDQLYKEEKDSNDRVGYIKTIAKKKGNKSKTCSIKKVNKNSKEKIKKMLDFTEIQEEVSKIGNMLFSDITVEGINYQRRKKTLKKFERECESYIKNAKKNRKFIMVKDLYEIHTKLYKKIIQVNEIVDKQKEYYIKIVSLIILYILKEIENENGEKGLDNSFKAYQLILGVFYYLCEDKKGLTFEYSDKLLSQNLPNQSELKLLNDKYTVNFITRGINEVKRYLERIRSEYPNKRKLINFKLKKIYLCSNDELDIKCPVVI